MIDAIVDRCRLCPITVIFVSTVLAAAPNKDRAYYIGWKYLSETIIERILQTHNGVRFCVLLPGRLVNKRTLTQPRSLLYTTYRALARAVIEKARAPRTQRQVIGWDAHALMIVRGARLLVNGALGRSA